MLGACSSEYFIQTEGNMPTKEDIRQIKRGMAQDEVRKILGSPSVISSLDHRTWIYMDSTMERMAFFEPKELDRNVLAVEFNHDGQVQKVVELTKENGRDIAVSKDATPVLGSEETFMEKILRRRWLYAGATDPEKRRIVNFANMTAKVLTLCHR